jgi:hemolysin D
MRREATRGSRAPDAAEFRTADAAKIRTADAAKVSTAAAAEFRTADAAKVRTADAAEFSTAAAALLATPPARGARLISVVLCAFVIAAVVYAYFARIDVVVSGQGRVIPSGRSKVVQPLDAGLVRAIHVRDGQQVKQGDVLVELDLTSTTADREQLLRGAAEADAEVRRLTAQLVGDAAFEAPADAPPAIVEMQRQILIGRAAEQKAKLAGLDAELARRRADRDAIQSSIAKLETSVPLVRKKHEMRESLARTGHVSQNSLIETNLEVIATERELAVQRNRLAEAHAMLASAAQMRAQAEAEFKSRTAAELAEATKRRDGAHQELVKVEQKRNLQTLRAPIDGVVQSLAVNTVGGVVTSAQALMSIVPEHAPLELEAQVLNRDIGHVRPGQRVAVRVETFDYTRYGLVEGEVQWVGTDAVVDQKLGPVYPVRVALKTVEMPNVVGGRRGALAPGMSVTTDIRVDDRRMIEYFLAPLLRYKEESLRER